MKELIACVLVARKPLIHVVSLEFEAEDFTVSTERDPDGMEEFAQPPETAPYY